jgi:putative effector of murein hydrolase LrgA (UPF0299 family)
MGFEVYLKNIQIEKMMLGMLVMLLCIDINIVEIITINHNEAVLLKNLAFSTSLFSTNYLVEA